MSARTILKHVYENGGMTEYQYERIDRVLKERERPQWIPCSERLPEKRGQYYVSGGDKVWICDFLIFSNFKGGWCNNVSNPVVEAWMPLPEPYEKEGEARIISNMKYYVCCPMCDKEKCVRGTEECDAEKWEKMKEGEKE